MATRRTTHYAAKSWMYQLSFWLVVLIGGAMALVGIMHRIGVHAFDSAAGWITHVCLAISLIIPVCLSYYVAWAKSTVWKVLWVIFVVLIVVGIILAVI